MSTSRFIMKALVCACCGLGVLSPLSTSIADSSKHDRSNVEVYASGAGKMVEGICIGDEGSDDYMLVIPVFDVDQSGNIFVLDVKLHHIKKFDANGTLLTTFSQLGEGPGDIGQFTICLAVTRDGTVMVSDYANSRIAEFSNDGEYLRQVKLEPMTVATRMVAGANGSLFVELSKPLMEKPGMVSIRVVRYNHELELVETVDSLEALEFSMETGWKIPYVQKIVWDVTPTGNLIIGYNNTYSVRVLSPTLELIRTIHKEVDPVATTALDKQRFVEGVDKEKDRATRQKVDLPAFKPQIVDLRSDHEGYLLICVSDEADSGINYDVYDVNGDYLNRVELPPMGQLSLIRDGYVYFKKKHEELLPQVCRGHLVPATSR